MDTYQSRRRTPGKLMAATVLAIVGSAGVAAQEIADGTLAAAIRSSGHACSHVVETVNEGPSTWKVKCNAGTYRVSKNPDATLAVTPLD